MLRRTLLLCGSAAVSLLCASPALALALDETAPAAGERSIVLTGPGQDDINPTQKVVVLTVPVRHGPQYLGDALVSISPDDQVTLSAERLFTLLSPLVEGRTLQALREEADLSLPKLMQSGVSLAYNPQELAVDVTIAPDRVASRTIKVSGPAYEPVGEVLAPAAFSAYLNSRGNIDYLHGEGGVQTPLLYLDGAARLGPVVLEGEGFWQVSGSGKDVRRVGSRLVFDDRDRLVRWTAGDLQPVGRGFQGLPEIAGLSVFRTYGVLEPQRIARPRGNRAFTLLSPSTIEVEVNGQMIRRLTLDPGNYDLSDFPFTQGANDVRLTIIDSAGQRQLLRFDYFFDQTQLETGLTEFGLYAGVLAPGGAGGPNYSNDPAISGFIRRGVSERLTLGLNAQADRNAQMAGGEGLWSTPIGTLGAVVAMSHNPDRGIGSAASLTFQRLASRGTNGAESLNLFVEQRSRAFSVMGSAQVENPFSWEAGGGYTRGFGPRLYSGIDGRYSRGRGEQSDIFYARGTTGYRVTDAITISGDLRWEKDSFERRLSGLLTATVRLGAYATVRADYDTRFDKARLSYSTFRGHGVGAYNLAADLDRSSVGTGANIAANYFANRAELGFSHYGSFDNRFATSLSQRSSVRFGSSIAIADGTVSVGRPIYDSFAIVRGHSSLRDASVEVERTPTGHVAETGLLGTAVHPNLPAFLTRTVTVEAPDAPPTADLGAGAFRVFPAYRSGYVLTVGSAFNVSAVGRLLNSDEEALALTTGTATLIGGESREPLALFTNKDGRFGVTGLGPGRWLIRMNDADQSRFVIEIAADAEGVVTLGELRSTTSTEQDI